MKTQRLLMLLTLINMGLLAYLVLSQIGPALAGSPVSASVASPVLRGRALEIVDDQGRVRASIKVQASGIHRSTGTKYPETVILRLIDRHGRPEVKIAGSEHGAGLSLVGETDGTQALLGAEGARSSLRLRNRDGRQQVVEP